MTVDELQKIIVSEMIKGNLKEDTPIIGRFYANSEWGTVDFEINHAKCVNNTLILSDEPIMDV